MALGTSIVSAGKRSRDSISGNDVSAGEDRWASAVQAQTENTLPSTVPQDQYWVYSPTIESERWNQRFPYQLVVVEARKSSSPNAKNIQTPDGSQGYSYAPRQDWKFTLPISPSELTMRTNFAIAVTALMEGVVRESNGARFRRISFSGTTGVLPVRDNAPQAKTASLGGAIFAGTVQNALRTASSATSLGQSTHESNLVEDSDTTSGTIGGQGTGYYQFRLLQQFLESYAAATSVPSGKNLRLALCMWKDQAVYLVEPEPDGFSVRRDATSPYEYRYELVFRAYRRINDLGTGEPAYDEFVPIARNPNLMAAALNGMSQARQTLSNARATLASVVPDVDQFFEPLRQTILFMKDAVGVSLVAADLPANLILEMKQSVIELMGAQQSVLDAAAAFSGVPAATRAALQDLQATIRQFASTTGKSTTLGGNLSSQTQALQHSAHPVHKIFANPNDNQAFFLALKPSALHLPTRLAKRIQDEQTRVRSMSRLDWENSRNKMAAALADFESGIGEGSAVYDSTFGRQTKAPKRAATSDDWDTIFAINSVIMQLDKLAASGTVAQQTTSLEYFATLATRSGIPFQIPRSKFAVPFPFGSTLERLAGLYLGDPDRWMEIAAVNNLQAPYVDEEGFDVPLLATGNGNQIVVGSAANLYVGQPVWISSNSAGRQRRRLTGIRDLGFNQVVLTLDGDPTLDQYTTLAAAALHAYLPNTVNSQMLVYLPAQVDPANEDNQTRSIPGIDFYDRLMRVGGVDLLLTSNNDIAWTPDGDCKLAVGLTNIVQFVRITIGIQRGQLVRHPEFGLGIKPGTSVADIGPKQLLKEAQRMFGSNPMFSGVDFAAVSIQGPATSIGLSIGVAGTDQYLPITADVQQ